jgi:catalase
VRWTLEPQTPFAALPAQVDDKQFLQHDLAQRLAQGPLRWTLRLTLAEPGDPVDDPPAPGPASGAASTPAPWCWSRWTAPNRVPAATSTSTR